MRVPALHAPESRPFLGRVVLLSVALATWFAPVLNAQQSIITKANTTTMNSAADWGGTAPGAGMIGQFGSTLSAANAAALTLGGNTTLDALVFLGTLNGPVSIGAGNSLSLGATTGTSGIVMSAANQDVNLQCSLVLAGNNTWNIGTNRALTLTGSLSGSTYNLTKSGSGTLNLGGGSASVPNTLNQIADNAGVINVTGYLNTAGKVILNGATMNWAATGTNTGGYLGVGDGKDSTLTVTSGTFVNAFGYSMFVAKGGSNSLTPVAAVNISGGCLQVTANQPIYLGSGIDGTGAGTGSITISGSGLLDTGTSTGLFQLGNNGGAGTVNLNSSGTLSTLRSITSGPNASNPGTSSFYFNGGTLKALGENGSFLGGLTAAMIRDGGGTINDGGYAITVSQSLLHSSVQGDSAVDGGLSKRGSGTLNLAGTNSYTGPTRIYAGVLSFNGLHTGSNTFTVSSGATLAGSGTINAPVVVNNGGKLAAGTGDTIRSGTLTTGALTLSATSTLALTLGSASKIVVNGNLTLSGTLLLADSGSTVAGGYIPIVYTGTLVNNGVVNSTASVWEATVDTSVPNEVRIIPTQSRPAATFTSSSQTVTATSLDLQGVLNRDISGSIWYEVRDGNGKLWDFGATIARSPWSITVRHLRSGTNTVTVFAKDTLGSTQSHSIQLTMNLGANPTVRPRPVPAEVWWGGLSDNSGMVNYDQWPFVQKYQDGYFFHSAGWPTSSSLIPSLATNLLQYNTKFWPELGGQLSGYGISDTTGQQLYNQWGTWAATLESKGIIWSEFTHDYRMANMQDVCQVNPTWAPNDQIAWFTGDLSIASGTFPKTSGIWRDAFNLYYNRFPHVKTGQTSQPEYWYWDAYPPIAGASDNLSFTVTNPTVSFSFNAKDIVASFINMATAIGHPYFAFTSDAPWNYFGTWADQASAANMREKIRVYETYLQSRGARHTLICNVGNAAAQSGGNDAQDLYYEQSSLNSLYTHQKEGGRANRYLFESWYTGIPHTVVPETKAGSYTHLALTAIKYLKGISDLNGTLEPLSLSLVTSNNSGTLTVTNGGDVSCMPAIVAYESGAPSTVTRYYYNGADVTDQMVSEEGFVITDQLAPGATATITMASYALAGAAAGAQRTLTFEAFWNPQDPTGVVRDRATATFNTLQGVPRSGAGALLVDLRANDPSASGSNWVNLGSLGGSFAKVGTPSLVSNVGNTGIPGIYFNGSGQAYQGPNSTSDIEGNNDRSIEVWAYNPSLSTEETMVSWGHRGATRQDMAFNFGSSSGYGAATHYGDDATWGASPPSANGWHHLVYTYGNSIVKIYIDGVLVSTKTLGGTLNTFSGEPINLGCQRDTANGTRSFYYSGYLNSVRIHGGILTDADIALNYSLGPLQNASSNASLGSLSMSGGVLSPAFSTGVTAYTATVPNSTSSITLTPAAADGNASIRVNGTSVYSGSPSLPIALAVGENPIPVIVTAQDGVTTLTYTVNVTRAPSSNASLAGLVANSGTLSPAFSGSTYNYSLAISNSTSSLTVTPTLSDSNASVKINNVAVASGVPSSPISLVVGSNTISIVATAQDGVTSLTYTLSVTRAPSTNAALSGLAVSAGSLNPAFSSTTANYTVNVGNPITSLSLTPTAADTNAGIKVNGTSVASGSASSLVSLVPGVTMISVAVTAQDGITTQTYTVGVNRSPVTTTYTFTPITAGVYGWSSPGNWDTNGVPVSGTTIGISFFQDTSTALSSGTCTVNSDPAGLTLNTLSLNGLGASGTISSATVNIGTAGNLWTFDGVSPTVNLNGFKNSTKDLLFNIKPGLVLNQNILFTGEGTAGSTANGFTFSGPISGARSLAKNGASRLTLSSSNTYSGGTLFTGGQLWVSANNALGSGTVSISGTAKQLNLNSSIRLPNPIAMDASSGAGTSTQGLIDAGNSNAVLSGSITISASPQSGGHFGSNTGSLTISGPVNSSVTVNVRRGTVIFSGTGSSYSNLSVQSGTTKLGANNGLATMATVDIGAQNGAVLDLGGYNQTLSGIIKSTNAATITNSGTSDSVLGITGTSTFAGSISDGATGKVGLTIEGGLFTLTGTTNYSGITQVNSGTLALGASNFTTLNGSLTLAAGARLDTTAKASFGVSQILNFQLNGAGTGSSGQIFAAGLDITNAVATFTVSGTLDDPVYLLATYTSKSGAAFASVTPPSGYFIDYNYASGTQIALVRLPGNNANLSSLEISGAILAPAFSGSSLNYTATVPYSTTSITVTPTAADSRATLAFNGGIIPLVVGINTVSIVVTAEDGITTKTYTVSIQRLNRLNTWRQTYFPGSTDLVGPGADHATPLGDGVDNLTKFATGMDPTKPGVMPGTASLSGTNILFSYTPGTEAVADGVIFLVEYSDTLAADSWKTDVVSQGTIGVGGSKVTAQVPKGNGPRRFVRLKIISP